jgi:hypothetical protein
MAVAMRMSVVIRMRRAVARRDIDDVAVPHAALGDDVIGERLHLRALALQHRHLEAALVVEVHVERRLRQVVMVVEFLRQALGKVARMMVVDIDQRGDAMTGPGDLDRGLLEARARQIADRLRAVLIAARRDDVTRCMGASAMFRFAS